LRASADSGQRGHFTTSGHVSIQVKSCPEIKVYPCKVLREVVGEEISHAMMEYFKPLMSWLEEQNKGRQIGWE
jgi:hypothetical protein